VISLFDASTGQEKGHINFGYDDNKPFNLQ